MIRRADGSPVSGDEASRLWADAAYSKLKDVASHYNDVIAYKDLALHIQDETGIYTTQLIKDWIGPTLAEVAQRAADSDEPPLTSLCVRADGTIGSGYEQAAKLAGTTDSVGDTELLAAQHRLLCYQRFAADLPEDGGEPTLTPQVVIRRRLSEGKEPGWLEALINKGRLSVNDRVPFRTHLEVARLFGMDLKGHQSATISLDETTEVWFPKLYDNTDWSNRLSDDGETITMRHVPGGNYGSVMSSEAVRGSVITFGHMKSSSGPKHYAFLGVFEFDTGVSNSSGWVHRRVADTIFFDGIGGYRFDKRGPRSASDDQLAETAPSDPSKELEYEARLEHREFLVEDEEGSSRVRGSAQRVFAKAVKSNYGWECAVTGIKTPAFLVASHIVPWSEDKSIRIDPSNGICLSTFVDRAFDAGFLEISPNGRTAVRWDLVRDDPILKAELRKLDDVELAKPKECPPDPNYLERRIELGY